MGAEGSVQGPPRPTVRLTLGALAIVVATVYMFVNVLATTMIGSPIAVTQVKASSFRGMLPQGWAFFTKDPESPVLSAYKIEASHRYEPIGSRSSASSVRDAFGFDRQNRIDDRGIGLLAEKVKRDAFILCTSVPTDCLAAIESEQRVRNPYPLSRMLCGEVGLVYQSLPAWAFRNADAVTMPSSVTRITVEC